jgi:hypothetical protein
LTNLKELIQDIRRRHEDIVGSGSVNLDLLVWQNYQATRRTSSRHGIRLTSCVGDLDASVGRSERSTAPWYIFTLRSSRKLTLLTPRTPLLHKVHPTGREGISLASTADALLYPCRDSPEGSCADLQCGQLIPL